MDPQELAAALEQSLAALNQPIQREQLIALFRQLLPEGTEQFFDLEGLQLILTTTGELTCGVPLAPTLAPTTTMHDAPPFPPTVGRLLLRLLEEHTLEPIQALAGWHRERVAGLVAAGIEAPIAALLDTRLATLCPEI